MTNRVSPLSRLKGFGPRSSEALNAIGIQTAEQLRASDPFELYRQLKSYDTNTSLNFLYAIIGAIEDVHWLEVKCTRRTEILLRLEEMGLAPR
jgi:DNA transformation protein